MISATAFEWPSQLGGWETDGEYLFVQDECYLYTLQNKEWKVLRAVQGYDTFHCATQGIWLSYTPEMNVARRESGAEFYDVYDKGITREDEPLTIAGDCDFLDEETYVIIELGKDPGLFLKRVGREETLHLAGDFIPGVRATRDRIIFREGGFGVLCCNRSLEVVWQFNTTKEIFSRARSTPILFGETAIVNLGEKADEARGEFDILAFDLRDGRIRWQAVVPTSPGSSELYGSRLFTIAGPRMFVIDAASGEIVVDAPHGFASELRHQLFPMGEYLIAASEPDSVIHVFSADGGTLLQRIQVPAPYQPLRVQEPIFWKGKVFMQLVIRGLECRGAYGALLTLEEEEAKGEQRERTVHIPERPKMTVLTLETPAGEHELAIGVSLDDVDEIIRYGTILLKELAYFRGPRVGSELDPKHNGVLRLMVDGSRIKKSDMGRLNEIAGCAEHHFSSLGFKAGNGKSDFKVTVEVT